MLSSGKNFTQVLKDTGISFVVIGALSGRHPIQPETEWIEEIVRACDDAGVRVFLKNNLNSENLPDNAFDKTGLLRQEVPL